MQKASWNSLASKFKSRGYAHTAVVGRFVERAAQELSPKALVLFGSLARGDFHQYSDADFCVVLSDDLPTPFAGYDRVVACDPSGVVQPVVYDVDSFQEMVRQAGALALEIMADGFFLAGDEGFLREIEQLAERTRLRLGIRRTPTGWYMARPDSLSRG